MDWSSVLRVAISGASKRPVEFTRKHVAKYGINRVLIKMTSMPIVDDGIVAFTTYQTYITSVTSSGVFGTLTVLPNIICFHKDDYFHFNTNSVENDPLVVQRIIQRFIRDDPLEFPMECPICMENIKSSDNYLPCMYCNCIVCVQCATTMASEKCPTCRQKAFIKVDVEL